MTFTLLGVITANLATSWRRFLGFLRWEAITHIIQYLKRAPGLRILYRPNEHLWVKEFTDANWASSHSNR